MRYATTLAQRGDSVDVFALRRDGFAPFEVLDGVNVYRIQDRRVNEMGRLTYLLRIVRFLLRSAYVVTRRHLANPYQLVHVHSVPDFMVFAALVPKLLGARVILDIHDILPEFYGSKFGVGPRSVQFKLLALLEKVSAGFADHVIIANDLWKERIVARSVPERKCTALCNYPDLRIFHPQSKMTRNGKFVILYPGSLNIHQGLDVALRAFAQIANQIPDADFHIYGEGPQRTALVALAKDLGLDGRVQFHGVLPIREIAGVMASSDLAIVPKRASSFGNEAASTKIMEFMALGVPVIVSRTKVDSYYFDDSVVRFFEPENENDLAKSILELRRDSRLRERLTTNAARYIRRTNWDTKKIEYLRLVDTLTRTEAATAA
jgi:glycosyltransferase involved in cell wall biosynthesis